MPLQIATEVQKVKRDKLTFNEWGSKLTLAQFLEREKVLRAHPWAQGAMTTWLWTEDDGTIMSSCETFQMENSHGIASVYTEPSLRGNGYASQMLKALTARFANADSLILFSEIGAAIYERSGFVRRESYDRIFGMEGRRPPPGVEFLDSAPALIRMARLKPARDSFTIWPSAGQVDWHFERERTYAKFLKQPLPQHSGAALGDSLIIWVNDFKAGHLQCLFLHAENPAAAEALISAARETARASDVRSVRIWESENPALWPKITLENRRFFREHSLSMIRPLHRHIFARDWNVISRALWI